LNLLKFRTMNVAEAHAEPMRLGLRLAPGGVDGRPAARPLCTACANGYL
jgi:hypothetical protein